MNRGIMNHKKVSYGQSTIRYMSGNETGYAIQGILLSGIQLTPEILIQAAKTGVRILPDGSTVNLDKEPGVIVFGSFKGDRPQLLTE